MVNNDLSYGQFQIAVINKAPCIELNWTISKWIKLIKQTNINESSISLVCMICRVKTQKKLMVVINLILFIKVSMHMGNPIFINSPCMEITWDISWTNIKSKCKLLNFQYLTNLTHFMNSLSLFDYKSAKKQLPTWV